MVNKKHVTVFLLLISCVLFLGCIDSTSNSIANTDTAVTNSGSLDEQISDETLLVYCGAGMRRPMDDIGVLFEEEYGVPVQYNYAGANTLLTQMELSGEGDVYMPGATYYFEVAAEKGFVDNFSKVVYHVPVIITPLDNPANIDSLDDFANDDVSVVLGDSEAVPIGIISDKMFTTKGIDDLVEANVVAKGATVNELVTYVSLNQADASIVWEDLVMDNEEVNMIEIAEDDNIIKIVPIATLTFSENPELAEEFVDFVVSDEGRSVFEEYGFTLYPDEKYAYLEAN